MVRPSDCFDLIVGTGMGGISALLLGRMGMMVDNAIKEYMSLAKMVFELSSKPCFHILPGQPVLS